ncbi:unnamed protein product [Amaranthus hypochondriacus]
MKSSSAEMVFIPTPGMGHLLSAVEVSKRIIQRDERLSIVILIIDVPITSALVTSFIKSQSQHNPFPSRLTFVTLPPVCNPPDPSCSNFFQALMKLYKPLVRQAVEDRALFESSRRLVGFILDMFCTTMNDVVAEFKVPYYVFFTSGASLLNLMLHFQAMADEEGIDIVNSVKSDSEFNVPGFVNPVTGKIIPSVFFDRESGKNLIVEHTRRFRTSKGILVNTFSELESVGINALLDLVAKDKIPAVYPAGPILELDNKSRSGSKGQNHEYIINWLNDQPSSSVVFLCFGSMGSFNEAQVKEIANGLEKSGHRFLWSLRKPPPEGKIGMPSEHETYIDALPEGFLNRTAERGKIIEWAPQVSILSHPAVGGFISHCGWNSTLESLWFGIPMAT